MSKQEEKKYKFKLALQKGQREIESIKNIRWIIIMGGLVIALSVWKLGSL